MLLTNLLGEWQILVRLTLMCCQHCCFMERGETLGGAEAGLAGGADKLGDVSALDTEHGDVGNLRWERDELSEIIRHFPLLVIPRLVLDCQRSQKMAIR